jgi:lipoprotein signal peptidase
MIRRLAATCATALAFALLDLSVKALVVTSTWDFHQRSHAWSTLAFVLVLLVLALGVLPSRLVTGAAGLVAGGAIGNVISAVRHRGLVPNPIVAGTIAFNLADLFVVLGTPVLVVALARCAIRQRDVVDRLIPPRRWELALRRRLGL